MSMTMWVLYDHPRDCPDAYVAREWLFERDRVIPTESVIKAPELETLREIMLTQMGKTCLPRNPTDDPVIIESWV